MLTMPPEGHVETEEGALPTLVMLNMVSTRLLPDCILLTCSISAVSMYFQSEWKTVLILSDDLDLHCFLKMVYLSSARQGLRPGPEVIKLFFMLNSTEHGTSNAHKD